MKTILMAKDCPLSMIEQSEDGSVIAVYPREKSTVQVMVSAGQTVEVEKEFGPLVAYPVRVRLDLATAEWVVEGTLYREDTRELVWEEKVRWDCQEDRTIDGYDV